MGTGQDVPGCSVQGTLARWLELKVECKLGDLGAHHTEGIFKGLLNPKLYELGCSGVLCAGDTLARNLKPK